MKLYRFYSDYASEYNSAGIRLVEYAVFRESESNYWIEVPYSTDKRKFKIVGKYGRRRFAFPTIEEALENYKLRTERYLRILRGSAESVERCLSLLPKINLKKNIVNIYENDFDNENLNY